MCMKENYTLEERRIVMEIKEILQNQESQAAMKQLMSDEIMNLIHENMKPRDTIMAYYRCAIMEVETKFKVCLLYTSPSPRD